jgi:hypothetical protein
VIVRTTVLFDVRSSTVTVQTLLAEDQSAETTLVRNWIFSSIPNSAAVSLM